MATSCRISTLRILSKGGPDMIKMIKGTYGLRRGDGTLEAMTPSSGPFSINEAREAELVKLGVAEKVDAPEEENPYEGKTMADLRKLAAERGVDVKAAKNKSEVIAALDAAEAEPAEAEEGESE